MLDGTDSPVEQVRPSVRKAEKKVNMDIRGERVNMDVRKYGILWALGSSGAAFWNFSEHDDVRP
jgi:hypothetical protein